MQKDGLNLENWIQQSDTLQLHLEQIRTFTHTHTMNDGSCSETFHLPKDSELSDQGMILPLSEDRDLGLDNGVGTRAEIVKEVGLILDREKGMNVTVGASMGLPFSQPIQQSEKIGRCIASDAMGAD